MTLSLTDLNPNAGHVASNLTFSYVPVPFVKNRTNGILGTNNYSVLYFFRKKVKEEVQREKGRLFLSLCFSQMEGQTIVFDDRAEKHGLSVWYNLSHHPHV